MFIRPRSKARGKTLQEQQIEALSKENKALTDDLMATQETAALLFEENASKDEQIMDLQDMIAELYEGGAEA